MFQINVIYRLVAAFLPFIAFGCAHGIETAKGHQRSPVVSLAESTTAPTEVNSANAVEAPTNVEQNVLVSKVTEVTVYSDRARVTRKATARLTEEPQVFVFRKLPGWVDDGSVRVASSEGRIADVRVEREFLAHPTDPEYRKAEKALEALNRKMAAIVDEIAILEAQKAQIESIKAFSLDKITKDTTIGDVSVQSYGDVVSFISDALRSTAQARREVQQHMDELQPEINAATARLDDMKSLLSLEETAVMVTIQSAKPVKTTLELTYMMPGATWEPMHELRVNTGDDKRVEVISFAVVSQTSGEDWDNARLSFSTQSTVQAMRIPELEALTLGGESTAHRVMSSRYSSFSRAQKAFEGQSKLWNKVQRKSKKSAMKSSVANYESAFQSNIEYLQVVQSRTVQLFESLENRGTSAHFNATAFQRVQGDGHPTRMRIGYSELQSTQKILAVPEQSLNAARTLDMLNTSGQPLLPGKVALYQDGAFIGMTDMDFIAREENFSLFFSVADHIKISREIDRKQSAIFHNRGTKMNVTFIVTAENLRDQATTLTLADRIPVSENREIRVSKVKIAPAVTPDTHGILKWNLTLKPKEKRQFTISYQLQYPPELIIETQRRRALSPAPPSAGTPNLNAPAKQNIEEQLLDLENMF